MSPDAGNSFHSLFESKLSLSGVSLDGGYNDGSGAHDQHNYGSLEDMERDTIAGLLPGDMDHFDDEPSGRMNGSGFREFRGNGHSSGPQQTADWRGQAGVSGGFNAARGMPPLPSLPHPASDNFDEEIFGLELDTDFKQGSGGIGLGFGGGGGGGG
eukprot:CAMPEP_0196578054 /NCGR_PEP_ID=MMETSP1081-20130531/7028_1 /TAXON_ID=36882 /ORGANISM="Pyramimonas amylifera, Strain CCMP720" /LENGTH=155 /DNA_ID=CAMNT_0041897159 /DNA_START=152 /DNA_END=616 /DNA_ORIENTATION=-